LRPLWGIKKSLSGHRSEKGFISFTGRFFFGFSGGEKNFKKTQERFCQGKKSGYFCSHFRLKKRGREMKSIGTTFIEDI